MKRRHIVYAASLMITNCALASAASAQADNFQLYNQAFLMCQDGNNLGYPDFAICVAETYQNLLQPPTSPGCGGGICVPDGTPPTPPTPGLPGCNSAETRLCNV
ncbi:hypothetical protein [Alteriqipengyuania lutimaris]|uniref:hypothetical protein n=1 Tax=Alteriqipengyuania lutimaris TaxID=1538146 RepID=UPI0011C0424D|nr:hypothetical protein [Alteriqipengyuania lutimaris]MBB3034184.1 hypothetical protein [Alteriqipengyuania lutimaris]